MFWKKVARLSSAFVRRACFGILEKNEKSFFMIGIMFLF